MQLDTGWERFDCLAFGIVILAMGFIFQRVSGPLASKLGLIDRPNERKMHSGSVPLSGGMGIFMPAALVLGLYWLSGDSPWSPLPALALTTAFAIVFITGLIDDLRGICARKRLMIQAIAAILLWAGGFRFDDIAVGGHAIHLGLLSLPLTIFWFMGFMNTSNLADGLDGISGGMNLIALLALGGVSLATGAYLSPAILLFAVLTAVFLLFNFRSRSKVFLGDSGSLTLGLTVATLALTPQRASVGGTLPLLAVVAPLAAYAFGMVDVVTAIFRRLSAGRSILSADNQHLHHRLKQRGLGLAGVMLFIHGVGASLALGAMILLIPSGAQVWPPILGLAVPPALASLAHLREARAAGPAAPVESGASIVMLNPHLRPVGNSGYHNSLASDLDLSQTEKERLAASA